MDKDGFMNLLFTHKEFPAVAPECNILALAQNSLSRMGIHCMQTRCKKVQIFCCWLDCDGCTPGMTRTGRLMCPIF